MLEKLETLRDEALERIRQTSSVEELEQERVTYLGKKSPLMAMLKNLRSLEPDERRAFGQRANEIKQEFH